ncbi:hypothetical protein ACFGZK_10925 [Pasteurella multocida]
MKTELLKIANDYRNQNKDTHAFMLNSGYVIVYDGSACSWRNSVRNPETEKPNAYLVGLSEDEIFIAKGGDEFNGAEIWSKL